MTRALIPEESQNTVEVMSATTMVTLCVKAERNCSPTAFALAMSISIGKRTITGPVTNSGSLTGLTP